MPEIASSHGVRVWKRTAPTRMVRGVGKGGVGKERESPGPGLWSLLGQTSPTTVATAPPGVLLQLQRLAGNSATTVVLLRSAYGDEVLHKAVQGEVAESLGWLSGQSMEALVAILGRAKSRKGLLESLLGGLSDPRSGSMGPAGLKRMEAAIRVAILRGGAVSGSDWMNLKLLMDAASLPSDQRAMLEKQLQGAKPGSDGLDTKLAMGDFQTVFAMLNGMSMEAMLKRLAKLGLAWLHELALHRSEADFLGAGSRGRLEVGINTVAGAIAGKVTADAVQQLNEHMAEIKLPEDQQSAVRAILPKSESVEVSISEQFANASISALMLPLAVDRTFKLLNGRSPEAINRILGALDDTILRALVANTRKAESKYDAETIRQGIYLAWKARHGDAPAPWDTTQARSTVADMPAADKVLEALRRSTSEQRMSKELAQRVKELMTPESLAMMATFTGLFIASQWTPAGWATDLLVGFLVVAGLVMAGEEVIEIVKHVTAFLQVTTATSEAGLDAAADHFAIAVTKLGVDVVAAILLHRVAKTAGPKGVVGKAVAGMVKPNVSVQMVTPEGVVIDVAPEALQRRGGSSGGGGRGSGRGPAGGQILFETTRGDGTTVIRSRVGRSPGRLGLEDVLPPGVEVGLEGWERAHSQGNITGAESGAGVRYAPREVNQHYQRLGIERAIKDLFSQKAPDAEVIMTTETSSHPGTLRLAEIIYRVDLRRPNGATIRVYEASLQVQNATTSPRIHVPKPETIGWTLLESGGWLKQLPSQTPAH